jgi:hypothetical protein
MNDKTIHLGSLRRKVTLPGPESAPVLPDATPNPNSDDEEECRAFGYLRGIRDRALSIEFRFADGNSQAFPYTWLGPMMYNPSAGILLKFTGDQITLVRLEGSNLNAMVNGSVNLFERGIQRHRVTWVREMPRQEAAMAREREVTVQRIRTLSYPNGEQPQDVEWLKPFQDQH